MSATGADPCARYEEALPSLLDLSGEDWPLGDAERGELREHAAVCPRCAALAKHYAATVELLRALPVRRAPPDFLAWVGGGIEAGRGGATWSRLARPRAIWLSAAALVIAGGMLSVFVLIRDEPAIRVARAPAREAPALTRFAEELADDPTASPRGEARDAREADGAPAARSPDAGKLSLLDAAAEAPEEKGTPLLAVQVPVQAGWGQDLQGLETELRALFEPSLKKVAAVKLERPDSRARAPSPAAAGAASAPAPPAAKETKPPAAGEFTLAIERGELLRLLQHMNAWALSRGGNVLEAGWLELGDVQAEMDPARADDAALFQKPGRTEAAAAEAAEVPPDAGAGTRAGTGAPPGAGERIQVRIRVEPAPARRR